MSKLTIIGDPHAKPNNLDLIGSLFAKVEELGNNAVWLGDFLDTKEVVRGKCLNLIYNRLKSSKLMHVILTGNHDYFNLECQDHSLQLLKELPNVKIVDELVIKEGLAFIPYIHDQKKLKETIKQIPKDTILFGHLELKGFDFGNGYICDKGITSGSFTKFKRVISGHFHKFQQKGNLTYLGTPFSHSFGESNQEKFLGVYNVETDNLELIPSEFPRHITLEIDCSENEPEFHLEGPDDYVRVILKGDQEDIDIYKAREIEWLNTTKVIERPTDQFKKGVQIEETLDNKVKFNTWAKDIRGLDEKTIQLGIDILEKVK